MAVYEILTVVLIVTLAIAAITAIYLGLLNWVGGFYIVRCDVCHHLTHAAANQGQPSCAHCRHPALLHPLYASHHRAQVPVRADPLRY